MAKFRKKPQRTYIKRESPRGIQRRLKAVQSSQERAYDLRELERRRMYKVNEDIKAKRKFKKADKLKPREPLSAEEQKRVLYSTAKKLKKEDGTRAQRALSKVGLSKETGEDLSRSFERGELQAKLVKAQLGQAFKRQDSTRQIKSREKAVRGILAATGVIAGKQMYAGPGRPRGTYIHGMPIQVYKRMMREKKAQFAQYQQEQQMKYGAQGFTPEQVQQLQQRQTIEELQQPSVPQAVQQLRARQQRIQILQQAQQGQRPQIPPPQQYKYAQDMPFQKMGYGGSTRGAMTLKTRL
jgi:hypothetical protein